MKDLKKRTSRAEQIALLKKRGMIIDDAAVLVFPRGGVLI